MAWATSSPAAERPRSLRLRIALTVAAFSLVLILAEAVGLLYVLDDQDKQFIDDILDSQIAHSLDEYARDPAAAMPNSPSMALYGLPADGPLRAPPAVAARLAAGNHEVHDRGVDYHVAVRQRNGTRFFLVYDVHEHEERLDDLVFLTAAGAIVIALLTLAAVYALAGRLTRSLDRLATRVTAGRGGGTYAEPCMEREVRAVAEALDRYAARQEDLLARERTFTSNVSHELRTPLTAIRTDAELLTESARLAEGEQRRAQRIVDTVDRIAELAQSLLMLGREAAPQLLDDVNLSATLHAAWEPLAARAAAKGVRLRADIPLTATLRADAGLVELILRNLLDNAVRHSSAGTIACRWRDGTLSIEDCGPGIAEAELPRMFERFYRGKSGSHGVGLALVKHVCDACGWRVEAGNAAAGGARVSIAFRPAGGPPAAATSQFHHISLTNP